MARSAKGSAEGRRIRAALVLAGRAPEDVAPELNISARTLERVIKGQRQAREWELERLAEILKVPTWFFLEGLEGQPTREELLDGQLAAMTKKIDDVDEKVDGLTSLVKEALEPTTPGVAAADRPSARRQPSARDVLP